MLYRPRLMAKLCNACRLLLCIPGRSPHITTQKFLEMPRTAHSWSVSRHSFIGSPMFGSVCSGRPVQFATQVEANKWVIAIENAQNVSHVAIFFVPNAAFDASCTALVYFQTPGQPDFKLLGGLNTLKPSAIYKLNNNVSASYQVDDSAMSDDTPEADPAATINVGISIEPTPQAEAQLAARSMPAGSNGISNLLGVNPATAAGALVPRSNIPTPSITEMAKKIVGNAYNYLGSFVDASGNVPMKAFDSWWTKFQGKLERNPSFLSELQE